MREGRDGRIERLLRLHDELDELTGHRGFRENVRTVVLAGLVTFILIFLLRLALDAGLGLEFGLVLLLGGGTAGGIQLWKWRRIRTLQERIREAEERGELAEPSAPRLGLD